MQYYESRFGAARVRGMVPQMKAVAAEHGIQMEYGGFVGNTLDSHVRIMLYFCQESLHYFAFTLLLSIIV